MQCLHPLCKNRVSNSNDVYIARGQNRGIVAFSLRDKRAGLAKCRGEAVWAFGIVRNLLAEREGYKLRFGVSIEVDRVQYSLKGPTSISANSRTSNRGSSRSPTCLPSVAEHRGRWRWKQSSSPSIQRVSSNFSTACGRRHFFRRDRRHPSRPAIPATWRVLHKVETDPRSYGPWKSRPTSLESFPRQRLSAIEASASPKHASVRPATTGRNDPAY